MLDSMSLHRIDVLMTKVPFRSNLSRRNRLSRFCLAHFSHFSVLFKVSAAFRDSQSRQKVAFVFAHFLGSKEDKQNLPADGYCKFVQ